MQANLPFPSDVIKYDLEKCTILWKWLHPSDIKVTFHKRQIKYIGVMTDEEKHNLPSWKSRTKKDIPNSSQGILHSVIIRALLYRIKKLDFMKRNCRRRKKGRGKRYYNIVPISNKSWEKFLNTNKDSQHFIFKRKLSSLIEMYSFCQIHLSNKFKIN